MLCLFGVWYFFFLQRVKSVYIFSNEDFGVFAISIKSQEEMFCFSFLASIMSGIVSWHTSHVVSSELSLFKLCPCFIQDLPCNKIPGLLGAPQNRGGLFAPPPPPLHNFSISYAFALKLVTGVHQRLVNTWVQKMF